MLKGNGTLVQVLFPILLRRQIGMLEKTVDRPYYYATPAGRKRLSVLLWLRYLSWIFLCHILRSVGGVLVFLLDVVP